VEDDSDEDLAAWVEYWVEVGRQHRAMMDLIQDALVVASINRAECDVCAHIFEMTLATCPTS